VVKPVIGGPITVQNRRNTMKTYKSLVAAMFVIATIVAQAQDAGTLARNTSPNSGRHTGIGTPLIVKNYLRCLDSDIPMVVESALDNVTCARIAWPGEDLRGIQKKLGELTTQGGTRVIRYKALTALEVFRDPAGFRRFIEHRDGNGEGLLDEIGLRILPRPNLVAR
jgi:hypothetical protein